MILAPSFPLGEYRAGSSQYSGSSMRTQPKLSINSQGQWQCTLSPGTPISCLSSTWRNPEERTKCEHTICSMLCGFLTFCMWYSVCLLPESEPSPQHAPGREWSCMVVVLSRELACAVRHFRWRIWYFISRLRISRPSDQGGASESHLGSYSRVSDPDWWSDYNV